MHIWDVDALPPDPRREPPKLSADGRAVLVSRMAHHLPPSGEGLALAPGGGGVLAVVCRSLAGWRWRPVVAVESQLVSVAAWRTLASVPAFGEPLLGHPTHPAVWVPERADAVMVGPGAVDVAGALQVAARVLRPKGLCVVVAADVPTVAGLSPVEAPVWAGALQVQVLERR